MGKLVYGAARGIGSDVELITCSRVDGDGLDRFKEWRMLSNEDIVYLIDCFGLQW